MRSFKFISNELGTGMVPGAQCSFEMTSQQQRRERANMKFDSNINFVRTSLPRTMASPNQEDALRLLYQRTRDATTYDALVKIQSDISRLIPTDSFRHRILIDKMHYKISNVLHDDIDAAQEKDQTKTLRSKIRQSPLQEDKKKYLEKKLDDKISDVLRDDIDAAEEKDQTNTLRSRIDESPLPQKKKERLQKKLDDKEFKLGNYFTLIDELFVSDEKYNVEEEQQQKLKEHYESCCRDIPSNQPSNESEETTKRRKLGHQRVCTYKAAQKDEEPAIRTAQSRSTTLSSKSTFEIWKTDLFGQPSTTLQEGAHLVPASVPSADTCWFVAEFLFGANSGVWDDEAWKKIRRLVHGTNETDTSGNKRRMDGTGIKHMMTNKIRLCSQEIYFDQHPSIVIVPIMDKPSALEWKTGEEYAAIILIDKQADEEDVPEGHRISLNTVACMTEFSRATAELPTASGEEIEKAITLLQVYTRAIHYAQTKRKPPQLEFDDYKGEFFYPKIHKNFDGYKVRKISFSNEGHPAPDPLLLVTKAIANIQMRHKFKMMAAADPADYFKSEQSIQAEEEYLEYLRHREKSVVHQNVVGMELEFVVEDQSTCENK